MLLLVSGKYLQVIEIFDCSSVAGFDCQLFKECVRKIGRRRPGGGRNQDWGGQGLGGVEDRGNVAIECEGLSPSNVRISGWSKKKQEQDCGRD